MTHSIIERATVTGNQFSENLARAGVAAPDQVAPAESERKLSLPANRVSLLADMPGRTPEEKKEQQDLISEQWALDERNSSLRCRFVCEWTDKTSLG